MAHAATPFEGYPSWVAYEPELVPPPELMAAEGIDVLEEWFRWGEEWSVLLRAYAGLGAASSVLEIGCGLGRVAFPLRYVLGEKGTYAGFEIVHSKIEFLQSRFARTHPNFRFEWANVRNTHYNPGGEIEGSRYRFPYEDACFDVVFAASVFTHMAPESIARYFAETARVLRRTGRCLFSFFLLDNHRPASERPKAFAGRDFDFAEQRDGFGAAFPDDPERMVAYRLSLVEHLARDAGLRLVRPPLPGYWSGRPSWISAQDLLVLQRRRFGGRFRRPSLM
jgi:SAM-dependent methyltransferase